MIDYEKILKTAMKSGGVSLRKLQQLCCDNPEVVGYSQELRTVADALEELGLVKRYINGLYSTTKDGQKALKNRNVAELLANMSVELPAAPVQLKPQPKAPAPKAEPEPRQPEPVAQIKPEAESSGPVEAPPEDAEAVERADNVFDIGKRRRTINVPLEDTSAELKRMSVDDLLIIFNLGAEAETIIATRLKAYGFPVGGGQ